MYSIKAAIARLKTILVVIGRNTGTCGDCSNDASDGGCATWHQPRDYLGQPRAAEGAFEYMP